MDGDRLDFCTTRAQFHAKIGKILPLTSWTSLTLTYSTEVRTHGLHGTVEGGCVDRSPGQEARPGGLRLLNLRKLPHKKLRKMEEWPLLKFSSLHTDKSNIEMFITRAYRTARRHQVYYRLLLPGIGTRCPRHRQQINHRVTSSERA